MRCKNCIYYIDSQICENGKCKENCRLYESISEYMHKADEQKYIEKYYKYREEY